ncbi:MAG: TOBE domain-containing protein [Rhizobiales bacterium]|nr:TOBE domain-containing protein [Hyphomicrobiales bacterium]
MAGKVHLTEPLGDVTVLDVEAGGAVLKMALPEEEALIYPVGTEIAVAFRPDAAHLFDQGSGKALR